MTDMYRADQVGSLLRPPELLHARDEAAAGRLSVDGLRAAEDRAVLDAIELQRQAGLDIFTDGELRRRAWMTDLAEAVDGFVTEHVQVEWHGPGGGSEASFANVAGGTLRQLRRLTAHETRFLKEHAPGPIKMTVPAPSNFLGMGFRPGLTDRFYPTPLALGKEVAAIIRGELLALADEGVSYLQLDAPYYCRYLDDSLREQLNQSGIDADREFDEAFQVDNDAFSGVARPGLTLALHICRGNSRSRWLAEGGYDRIAERLFGSLNVDRFLLEYDTERSGGFEPLRFVPRGKSVVLGLITTKQGRLETVDQLRSRIEEASKYVPLEYLALSPQCGFASTALGNALTMDEQRQKLELVAQAARAIWG